MSEIPGPIQKRDIMYGVKKTSPQELSALAKKLIEAGWDSDAADFYNQARDEAGLKSLRARAVEEGNTFLFTKISRYLNESEVPKADLLKCAQVAESQGKFRYAMKAYEKLEMTDELNRIRGLVAGDGDIVAEAESTVFIPENEDELAEEGDEEDE